MLRATLLRRAAAARTPSMKFPDRKAQQPSHEPHPHPAAPKQVADNFKHFQEVFKSGPHFDPSKVVSPLHAAEGSSSKSSPSQKDAAEDLHDLPPRFWRTPAMMFTEAEIEAINSGGASLR